MVNIGAIFGRGGNKDKDREQQTSSSEHHESSEQHESSGNTEKHSSEETTTKSTITSAKQVQLPKEDIERVAAFGHKEEPVFERAKRATKDAEQAAKLASANAERAFRLVAEGETARKEVETIRHKHEEIRKRLDDTKIADVEAKAKKDQLADLRAAFKSKGQTFDKVRAEARNAANEVKEKSSTLEGHKSDLSNLEGEHGKANQNADHLRGHLKEAEAKKPDHDNAVREAFKVVETHGEDIGKLERELNDAQKKADDLERQAKEARETANRKKQELDNATQKKTVVVKEHDQKKGLASDLEKKIADLKTKLGEQDRSIKELDTRKTSKRGDADSLAAELEKLKKAAQEKDEEARRKRKEYEDLEARLKQLEGEAGNAAEAQKQALQTRTVLTKEFDEYTRKLEVSEVRLAESTEEAKLALEAAKKSDSEKSRLLGIAEAANREADDLTHKKISTVEDVLSEKFATLTQQSKEVMEQVETTKSESSKVTRSNVSVDKEGPATPDLTKQATREANQAEQSVTSKGDNGTKSSARDQASKVKSETQKSSETVEQSAQKMLNQTNKVV